jgi:hypothetical protein
LNSFEGELAMKTDEDSGEADEPPEEPPSSECRAKKLKREENEELQRARNHRAQDQAHLPESRPASANAEPATEPAAQAAFRKTELRDKPPLFRSGEPVLRQKTLSRMLGQDTDIPYMPYEDALRSLTAAIVQHQETIARRIAGEVDELHDRLDALEDRIELAMDRLDRRVSSLEKERES